MLETGEIIINPELGEAGGPRIPREIKRIHITLMDELGHGQFGEVWKALLDESSIAGGAPEYLVAAKTVKNAKESPEGSRELLAEAALMAQVGVHKHLVSLIGTVTSGDPLILVVAFCEHGSLLSALLEAAADKTPVPLEYKAALAVDIAKGMAYLHQCKYIHRDLAARNVLVATGFRAKVADFGLSRSTELGDYYRSKGGMFPVRWTSPETCESLKFTAEGDVWSFGVVLLEVYQDGKKPYFEKTNAEVYRDLMTGYRAKQPAGCDDAMYSLMLSCWDVDPTNRPTFDAVADRIAGVVAAAGIDVDMERVPSNQSRPTAGKQSVRETSFVVSPNHAAYGVPVVHSAASDSGSDYLMPTAAASTAAITTVHSSGSHRSGAGDGMEQLSFWTQGLSGSRMVSDRTPECMSA
jgi:serine/threonine protein kinase